jgi:hypothetical protein
VNEACRDFLEQLKGGSAGESANASAESDYSMSGVWQSGDWTFGLNGV